MNSAKVLAKLHKLYSNGKIKILPPEDPSEIVCEIERNSRHSDYDLAIAIIDKSAAHKHLKTQEIYRVTLGELKVFIDGKETILKEGVELIIEPGQVHWAEGNETWIECYSKPGWTVDDHILV